MIQIANILKPLLLEIEVKVLYVSYHLICKPYSELGMSSILHLQMRR